ncbi:DUF2480 family protein [Xanthomarina sp. F2636L]|uniref:DUF2480 family protein n=1 Tax=Xanthomarina sp. F2636L TaxID=2996018 RepID=UPI00225E2B9D|nr:DUF2480 family protein [Xanthomarina sp. F2636L]MCX7551094.1 DUF2480 family protein [Xanthomarina sp. F2636L]
MEEEIINRVANSKLVVLDLEDYYPEGKRIVLDVKDWLFEGFVLREKEFRKSLKEHDWTHYQDCFVALTCSSDAIIPAWAYMLIGLELETVSKKTIIGTLEELESSVYQDIINGLNLEEYIGKPVIIKGCAHKPVPRNAYIMITEKLKPLALSIMYGEACSSVPLYKKPKTKN